MQCCGPFSRIHLLRRGLVLCVQLCVVALVSAESKVPAAAAAAAGKIYWSLNWPHKIQRSNLDGSEVEDVVTGLAYPHGLAIDAERGKLYWSDSSALLDKIQRSDLDGSSVEDILEGHLSWGIAVDSANGKLYWSDMVTQKIHRSDLDGSHVEDVVLGPLEGPAGLALDVPRGHIYWSDNVAGKVQRADLGGSGVEDLIMNLSYPQALALDVANGKLYWTDSGTFRIQRANLDGSLVEDVITQGLKDPYAIVVDSASSSLYWSSVGTWYDRRKGTSERNTTGKIQRSTLQGEGVEDLVLTGRPKIFAIALTAAAAPGAAACAAERPRG